ncbi:hypothetical protein ABT086_40540 [Streptomyces mirabilis]
MTNPAASARSSRLVPPAGPQRVLALAQLTNSVGDGAYYVTSALYFTHVVGLAPARVGLGLTVAWAVGSLVGVPLGRLADRRGPRGRRAGSRGRPGRTPPPSRGSGRPGRRCSPG